MARYTGSWLGSASGSIDDQRLAGRGHLPAQALAEPEPLPGHDRALRPVRRHADQLVALDQPQAGALDVEQVRSLLRDPRERLPQSRPEAGSSFDCHRVPTPEGSRTGRSVRPRRSRVYHCFGARLSRHSCTHPEPAVVKTPRNSRLHRQCRPVDPSQAVPRDPIVECNNPPGPRVPLVSRPSALTTKEETQWPPRSRASSTGAARRK